MDFPGVLQAILAATTIIGVALAGLQRGVVTNLRETAADLRNRADDLAKERTELEAENSALKADLAALGRVVTGEAYLTALGEELRAHHIEAKEQWHAATELGQQILDRLNRITDTGGTG